MYLRYTVLCWEKTKALLIFELAFHSTDLIFCALQLLVRYRLIYKVSILRAMADRSKFDPRREVLCQKKTKKSQISIGFMRIEKHTQDWWHSFTECLTLMVCKEEGVLRNSRMSSTTFSSWEIWFLNAMYKSLTYPSK